MIWRGNQLFINCNSLRGYAQAMFTANALKGKQPLFCPIASDTHIDCDRLVGSKIKQCSADKARRVFALLLKLHNKILTYIVVDPICQLCFQFYLDRQK